MPSPKTILFGVILAVGLTIGAPRFSTPGSGPVRTGVSVSVSALGPVAFGPVAFGFAAAFADDFPALSDWGAPGLLQTPSARLPETGAISLGATRRGARFGHVFGGAALFPWLWGGVRQTAYDNDYGLYEPGVDLAVRLMREDARRPALVVGWRDALGTGPHLPGVGRFAGEYLVASKRFYALDFSAGVGWGRLGGRKSIGNPIWGRNRARPATGPAARGPRNWFTGETVGLFGGATWRPAAVEGLALSVEYAADDAAAERAEGTTARKPFPVNVGASWRPFAAPYHPLELAAGFEGGRDLMFRLALRFGADDWNLRRTPPPPAVPAPRSTMGRELEKIIPPAAFRDALPLFGEEATANPSSADAGFFPFATFPAAVDPDAGDGSRRDATIRLTRPAAFAGPPARDVGRALRTAAAEGPQDADRLIVAQRPHGLDGAAVAVPRAAFLRAAAGDGSAEELLYAAEIAPASVLAPDAPQPDPAFRDGLRRSLRAGVRLVAEESLFEHAAHAPGRSYVDVELGWAPAQGVDFGATLRNNISHTLYGLNDWATAAARPVRSDVADYAEGRSVERLYASLRRSPTPDRHVGVDAGWLEEMYGGFGGEALLKPFAARWAAGLAAYRVWKRAPDQVFRLRYDQGATTALASFYYEGEGGAWTATADAGRYLGGDWGGGVAATRRLPGEAALTVWAVFTDGPDETRHAFYGGKGEYGVRLTVPLNAFGAAALRLLTGDDRRAPPLRAETAVRTLGRDAGQKLDRPAPLFQTLSDAGVGRLTGGWSRLLE